MAILARALISEFPEHEDLFRIGALKLGRKIIRNHNGMLGRYPGADGMKTGFICAGGFNIVASSTQNGRRLIAVVMGYPTARQRDLRAANLFDQGFASLGWGAQSVEQLPPSAVMSPPNMRPYVCGPNKRLPQEDDETAVIASASSGNSDNPIASLFTPATLASSSIVGARILGTRTSLGPRVAFEPVPIWLGASPGATPDDGDKVKAKDVRIAAKPVRTNLVAGSGKPAGAGTASASLSATVPAPVEGEGEKVETLKAKPRPGGRAALSANLEPKPAANTKPKLGALGGAGKARAKFGAIELKPTVPIAALTSVALPERQAKQAGAKPAAKAKVTASASKKRGAAAASTKAATRKTE
jgi:D-alanyl-D-alanine carboxypeptidase